MKKCIYICIVLCSINSLFAQDIFFSQFYNSPLTLNPALTGVSGAEGLYNLTYRNNDRGLIPYTTTAFSGDMSIYKSYSHPDMLGVGLIVASDRFNDGQIANFNGLLSGAYHKKIHHNKYFSAGLQLGIFQRKFDLQTLSFGEQYNPQVGFDESMASQERFGNERSLNFDFNMGLLYSSFVNAGTSYFLGVAAYHLNAPKDKFQNAYAEPSRFPVRYVVHGGGRFRLSEYIALTPRAMWLMQNNNVMLIHGLAAVYQLDEYDVAVDFGAWFRHSDNCLIASMGIQFSNYYLAISSDFISALQTVSRTQGALELSLRYRWNRVRDLNLEANPRNRY